MVNLNDKILCENCFEEVKISHCPNCGYDPSDSICDPLLLQPGSVLSEKYIVGGVIGMGGFGITYLAYDKSAGRKVAVKEYFPRSISHRVSNSADITVDDRETFDMGAEKFYNEAKMIVDFSENPNIVKIYDIFRANNTVYLVMEFLRGKTIKEYIRDRGVLDAPSVLYIADCVLNALSETHSARVLHRDISPDNIILCGNGDVKLIDFGAARQIVDERTQNFSTIVKYGFASPEQYRKRTDQGAWSDVYSLGSTMYYALTGDIPADPISRFDNDDTYNENNFGIDDSLWSVITKATKLNAEERYQSAEEMREALDKLPFEPRAVTFSCGELFRPVFRSRGEGASSVPSVSADEARNDGKNKGFWRNHGYLIAVAAASFTAAALCFALLFVLNGTRPGVSEPTSSKTSDPELSSTDLSGSEPVSSEMSDPGADSPKTSTSDVSEPETPPVPLTETFPYFGEYETKAWYLGLNEKEQEIYKMIYDGLSEGAEFIEFPYRTYTFKDVQKCYFLCVYDNPWICNVGDFTKNYNDENRNNKIDPEEYMTSIQPDYLKFIMDVDTLREQIEKTIGGEGDTTEKLRRVHDTMVREVAIVARYVNQSCTHAYGSIVHKVADDMGIAQGFCVYAQAMGLPCRVIDGTKNGEVRAWCAVKLDDTWYNVDVYGDLFAHSTIDGNIHTDRNTVYHTYFLANDEYFKEIGYEPNSGWDALGGEEFSANSPYENYYIQYVEGAEEYFNKDAQSAYDVLLGKASEAAKNGDDEISVCLAPYLVNELYDIMNDTFISDCMEEYGVQISAYKVQYNSTEYSVKISF